MPTCENCSSFVTERYLKVFAPDDWEDKKKVRACPSCDDKVRDKGQIRDARAPTNGGRPAMQRP